MNWIKEVVSKERKVTGSKQDSSSNESGDEAKFPSIPNSNVSRIEEDVGSECQTDSECLPSKDCPYYQEQQDLLKSLTNQTSKTNIVQQLRSLICNRQQRAVCCPNVSGSKMDSSSNKSQDNAKKQKIKNFCYLPPEYRGVDGGTAEFLEDCDTLGKIHLLLLGLLQKLKSFLIIVTPKSQ